MRAVSQLIVVTVAVLGLTFLGCGGDAGGGSQTSAGDTEGATEGATEGTTTEGTATEGTATGFTTEGTATEGTATEGTATEGTATEGTATEGTTTEGTATEGTATEGTTTEGTATEGTTTEGTTTEGTTSGAGCENLPSSFSEYASHVVVMELPLDPGSYACDANNDGEMDSKDGDLNALVKLAGDLANMDLNGTLAENIGQGDLFLNLELAGYEGTDITDATINFYLGDPDNSTFPSTCDDTGMDGTVCDVSVDPLSFDADCKTKVTLPGASITGNKLSAGPQKFSFALPLGELTLDLQIDDGRFFGDIDGNFNLAGARLCGKVDKKTITEAIDQACLVPSEGTKDLCGAKGLITGLLTCNPCTITLSMEGAKTNLVGVSE